MGLLSHVGRPANPIEYRKVDIHNASYYVGALLFKDLLAEFVIDESDYELVKKYSWHVSSNSYIGSTYYGPEGKKEIYLHNLIMDRVNFAGKGQAETVDHINRNGFDNRRANLRIVPQSAQATNQAKKKRSVILPEGCGINPDTIPKHIWYIHPNGLHGDRFAIEFKTEGIIWKSTSSKRICLEDKLKQAVTRLNELYATYPHLNPVLTDAEALDLERTYGEIIAA